MGTERRSAAPSGEPTTGPWPGVAVRRPAPAAADGGDPDAVPPGVVVVLEPAGEPAFVGPPVTAGGPVTVGASLAVPPRIAIVRREAPVCPSAEASRSS